VTADSRGWELDSLRRYLAEKVHPTWEDLTVAGVTRSAGGLSWETYFVDITALDRTAERLVLKLPPLSGPLAPYDISREAILLAELSRQRAVPVPRLIAYETDVELIGRPFSLLEYVAGEIPLLRRIDLWDKWRDTTTRTEVGFTVVDTLARIQSFDWRRPHLVGTLKTDLTPADHVHTHIDRLMNRIDKFVVKSWAAQPVLREAWWWLHENLTDIGSEEAVLVHGDYRIGNLIWQSTRIVAVLDWERADIGDPMADLAFFCMPMARQPDSSLMGMLLPFELMVERYEEASGRSVDLKLLQYYVIYWQFVELAQIVRALVFSIDEAARGELRHVTSYPLLSIGAEHMLRLMRRFDAGDHSVL
jgi:aminoglycoside phosphotransferase (APT) family kinase protein